jgi:hypothetical protein
VTALFLSCCKLSQVQPFFSLWPKRDDVTSASLEAPNRLRERTSSLHGGRTQADLGHGEEDARLAGCVFELPKITMDTIQTEQPREYKKR